jgi:hypothetical protein
MLQREHRLGVPFASPIGLAAIAGLVLLWITVESVFAQQAPIRGEPGRNIRASTSMVPPSAMLNSRPILRIRVRTTVYELECAQRQASAKCSVVPNVDFDPTDLDFLSKRSESFRLGLCDNESGSCRTGVPWSPRSAETNLQKNGLSGPGTFYLSWRVGGCPNAALSDLLVFRSGPSPSTQK